MAITTWAQVQLILGLDAAQQTLVEALIPHVEEGYLRIRNKPFDVGDILTITAGATADGDITITLDDGIEETVEVENGDNAVTVARKIYFALVGLYYFTVTVSGEDVTFMSDYTTLTLAFDGGTTGVTATTTGLQTIYPTGAEYTAIKMIQYQLTAAQGAGISSESLGDYSVTYDTATKAADYPNSIVGGIKRYVSFT